MSNLNNVLSKLKKITKVEKNVDLSKNSTFQVGGKARIVVFPSGVEELLKIIEILQQCKVKFTIIGNASNVLFSSDGYDGVVIKMTRFNRVEFHGKSVLAYAGANLNTVIVESVNRGLKGLEDGYLIPATVGGAVKMNASSSNFLASDVVESVLVLSDGKIKLLNNTECEFGYRKSVFKDDDFILRVQFKLEKGDKKQLKERLKEIVEYRKSIVPTLPSAGCVFKNPVGYSAGQLIEEANLKGYSIGGAMVSPKHSNIIINCGRATSDDIKSLINHIKSEIKRLYDIELELEIKIIE